MDTKYWGPSGWSLLHLITIAEANPSPQQKKDLECFFSTLPYVLPCKYCRASLSEYMVEHPLSKALESDKPYSIARWLWTIHNCVNAKLRSQKLHVLEDPPFSDVKERYIERYESGCTKTKFEGWEFLFSIVENHPYSKQSLAGIPIPGAPDNLETDLEKNQWNVLPAADRMKKVEQFWRCLPLVFPYPEWKTIWSSCSMDWSSRASALKTLWQIRCRMESELELLNKTNYHSLCYELKKHRSGCSKSKRAKTCRKKRGLL
jgi:hypothetical protein